MSNHHLMFSHVCGQLNVVVVVVIVERKKVVKKVRHRQQKEAILRDKPTQEFV